MSYGAPIKAFSTLALNTRNNRQTRNLDPCECPSIWPLLGCCACLWRQFHKPPASPRMRCPHRAIAAPHCRTFKTKNNRSHYTSCRQHRWIPRSGRLINLGNNLVTGGAPATFSRDSGVSVIQASAVGDLVGNIELDAPEFDLSGEISPLRQQLLSADAIDQHPCAQSDASSLASSGSGGLPTSPAGYLSFRSDSGAVSSSSRSSSTNTQQIVSNMVQARLCEHGVL